MNILKIGIIITMLISFCFPVYEVLASNAPKIHCEGIPGCEGGDNGTKVSDENNSAAIFLVKVVSTVMKYVSVIAVLSLMMSGVLYLFSSGEEEKTEKAKKWIIWSLVGVLVSMSAWMLVNIVLNFTFISGTTS
ncbi:MAG: hypothetical protein GY828_04075 [Candidatus Gracilibacteria bacterium]|nr:hypothetical protein [Candidatus Gracilibacteria bacterium]